MECFEQNSDRFKFPEEREQGKIAGDSIRNLWDVLFWLQEKYPNEEWLERDINSISRLLKDIQDEFSGISLDYFNNEFIKAKSDFHRSIEGNITRV